MSDSVLIGLQSVSGRPTYVRYITDLRPTNHLPSEAELRPIRTRTVPDKNDTTPKYNRETAHNLSGRDLWKICPDQFVGPNEKSAPNRQNQINTDCKPNLMIFVGLRSVSCRFGRCDWGMNTHLDRRECSVRIPRFGVNDILTYEKVISQICVSVESM